MKTTTNKEKGMKKSQESQKQSFEDAVSELEKIINVLEHEDLSLKSALNNFEQGVRLVRICDDHLKTARGKIIELVRSDHGDIVEKVLGETLESFLDGEEYHD